MPRPRKRLQGRLVNELYVPHGNTPVTPDGYSRNAASHKVYTIAPGGERLYQRRNGDVIARKNPGPPARENAEETPTTGQRKDPSDVGMSFPVSVAGSTSRSSAGSVGVRHGARG